MTDALAGANAVATSGSGLMWGISSIGIRMPARGGRPKSGAAAPRNFKAAIPVGLPSTSGNPERDPADPERADLQIGPNMMEFQLCTNLDWHEIAELMHVTETQILDLTSGDPASAEQHRRAERLLETIRRTDRGEDHLNRAMLLDPDEKGERLFDLLKEGRYDEMVERAGPAVPRKPPEYPPRTAEQEARRPPPPWVLMDALPDRPELPGKGIPEKSFPVHKRHA